MGAAAVGLIGLQLYQGYAQSQLMERNGEITQQLAEMNAEFTEIDAWEAEKFGYTQAAAYEKEVNQTIGSQRVAMAAQNVDVTFGTAAAIQTEARLTGVLNVMDIKNQARQKARGLRTEAANIRLGGQMSRSQSNMDAGATRSAAMISAAGTAARASGYGKAFKGSDSSDSEE